MPLSSLSDISWTETCALLCEGFPETDPDFWERGLRRYQTLVGKADTGFDGVIQRASDNSVSGVMLYFDTPTDTNANNVSANRVRNLSSWYVRPEYRMRAPIMLKTVCEARDATFTDFSPSPSVQALLPRLGFVPLEKRTLLFPTPRWALRRTPENATAAALASPGLTPFSSGDALAAHKAIGCQVIEAPTRLGNTLFVFQTRWRKRVIKSARLIYAPDADAFVDALPQISRDLARKGVLLVEADLPASTMVKGPYWDRGAAKRFVKGQWPDTCINYLFSEIPVLGL